MDWLAAIWLNLPALIVLVGFINMCCCGSSCLIDSDDFPGGSETGSKWSSGKFLAPHPDSGTDHYATATFTLADGQNGEVRVNMKSDSSEYHWGKLARSGTTLTLTIGKTGSTLDTKVGNTGGNTEFTLVVCYANGALTALGTGGSSTLNAAKASLVITDGIYTGRAGSGTFSYFEFQKHYSIADPSCPNCTEPQLSGCPCCDAAKQPPSVVTVDLGAGGWTDNGKCSACPDLSGEFGLAFLTGGAPFGDDCKWRYCGEPSCTHVSCCTGNAIFSTQLDATLDAVDASNCKWVVTVNFVNCNVGQCGCTRDPADTCDVATATYESSTFTRNPTPANDCRTVSVTLTKVSEDLTACGSNAICGGSLPSTISLYGNAI